MNEYYKQTWRDMAGTGLDRYEIGGIGQTVVWKPRSIVDYGTPVTATRMNYLEAGIETRAYVSMDSEITINPSDWSNTAPYTYTRNNVTLRATDDPDISPVYDYSSVDVLKAQKEAYNSIDSCVTSNGSMTFYCFTKKPTIPVTMKVRVIK